MVTYSWGAIAGTDFPFGVVKIFGNQMVMVPQDNGFSNATELLTSR